MVNQIEDLKKLQLIKDSEINKLNEQNLSKSNEITRLKKELNDKKEGKGIFYYNNGSKYEGIWNNDERNCHLF